MSSVLTEMLLLPLLLRALDAECWCSPGAVHAYSEGWRGEAGCEQGSADLLSTSRLTQFTRGCHRSKSTGRPHQKLFFSLCSARFHHQIIFLLFQTCLLLSGLFPLVYTLCEEKLDCHHFVFEGE